MPEAVNPNPASGQPAGNPAPAPAATPAVEAPSFKLPEKFTGKSLEDVVKSYQELETKYGETQTKYKDFDVYSKIGKPSEINEALDWARNVKRAMESGLLVPRGQGGPAGPVKETKPWEADDWAYKSPAEQASLMDAHAQQEARKYIDGLAKEYRDQLGGLAARDAKEKSLLLQVVKAAIQNPGVDPEALLTKAAELGNRSGEELLQMAMENLIRTPEAAEKEIERRVTERLAEEKQKRENEQFADITTSRKPRFGQIAKTRADEDRAILSTLSKQGIRLL